MDFIVTFSLVAKIVTVKLWLSLTASFGWLLVQMDVNNAFFNDDLFEEVYLALTLGYFSNHNTSIDAPMVCKLHQSIYGLKQASLQWFHKFFCVLASHAFIQSKTDYSLFTRGSGSTFVALLVYVDGILLSLIHFVMKFSM